MSETSRTTPPTRRIRSVRLTTRTAVLTVGTVVAVVVVRNAFAASSRVLGWAVASAAIAMLVEPLVNALGRFIPRVAAVLLTFAIVGVGVGALVFGVVDDLDREVDRLQRAAPEATARLEARDDELGGVMRDLQISERIDELLAEVDERVGSGGTALAQNAPTAPIYFVGAILTVFLLLYGPAMAVGAAEQVAAGDRRDRLLAALYDAVTRARRTVAALLAQSVVIGLLVGAVAWLIDLPAPVVLGLFAGVAAALPDLGILLGVLPTVALAAGLENARTGVAILAVAFVLQAVEALWLRARIDRWGVAVGPAIIWIVAIIGYQVHGVGMAAYGVGYAILGVAILERLPDLRDPVAPSTPAPSATSA